MVVVMIATCSLVSGCNQDQKDENRKSDHVEQTAQAGENGGMMDGGMMGHEGGMMDGGMMSDEMHKAMMSGDMGPDMMEDMKAIRELLMNHEQIDRRVENLDNGVKTWTTSDDPEIAAAIQKHVRQMEDRMKEGNPIRRMDPVFREIFKHADKINMEIEDVKNGLVVTETSDDPQVVKLIQQHANRAVSEFVDQGMQRAMQPTPLPEGYVE
jgi:hypothetical protein